MMPGIARVVHALLPCRGERPVARGRARIVAHRDQPWLLVQGHEQLAAERMAFHQLDQDRARADRTIEQTDIDRPALRRHVDPREAVETLCEAVVDQLRLRTAFRRPRADRRGGGKAALVRGAIGSVNMPCLSGQPRRVDECAPADIYEAAADGASLPSA